VAVNETRASVQRHIARHPLPFRFLWDATGAAVRAYQAPTTSYVVALDARGRVVYTGTGEDQDIEAVLRRATGS
jgi:predicted transcriptional regulator